VALLVSLGLREEYALKEANSANLADDFFKLKALLYPKIH
jgi:hypothetical protein